MIKRVTFIFTIFMTIASLAGRVQFREIIGDRDWDMGEVNLEMS